MKTGLRRRSFVVGFVATMLIAALPARSGAADDESYPSRPVRLVVPSGAGGITDILARIVAQRLTQTMGQSFVVFNRTGASGMIGSNEVTKAAPDGYTLLFAYPSLTINPSIHSKIPYDTLKDFAPISTVGSVSSIVTVRSDDPVRDLDQLIAQARAKPKKITFAIVGTASLGHIALERLLRAADVQAIVVPYNSAPEAQSALLGGTVDVFVDTPITAIPLIRAGKVRGLGVSTATRLSALPDVPTIAESLPAYGETTSFNAVLAPAGTPQPIVDKLDRAIDEVLRDPAVQASFREKGVEPMASTPAELATRMRTDIPRWGAIIRQAGIQAD